MSKIISKNSKFCLGNKGLYIQDSKAEIIITSDNDLYINSPLEKGKIAKKTFTNFIGKIDIDDSVVFSDFLIEKCDTTIYRAYKEDIDKVSIFIKNSNVEEFTIFDYLKDTPNIKNMIFTIEESTLGLDNIMIYSKDMTLNVKNVTTKIEREKDTTRIKSSIVYFCENTFIMNSYGENLEFIIPFENYIVGKIKHTENGISDLKTTLETKLDEIEKMKSYLKNKFQ